MRKLLASALSDKARDGLGAKMITKDARILLVDDLNLIRRMLRQCLDEMGFKYIEDATDGNEAIFKLSKARSKGVPFDLLFLDWNMPNKTGIEVVEYCRASELFKDLPIIMVTAEAEKKNVLRALMNGANDYIVKPVSADILRAKLDHINEQLKKKVG
ncbi:MAG: hypothetical protein C5B49_01675 [Bdellovibrio sp.]|nr:MAG: hypothetical protein C5B49_01675 [Bdellovibrio sp.]